MPPPPPLPPTDAPPYASFTSSCPQGRCTFDASASTDDHGIVSYRWDFGDGTAAFTTTSAVATHTYSARGQYAVTLIVSDGAGQTGTTQRILNIKRIRERTPGRAIYEGAAAGPPLRSFTTRATARDLSRP